jgi:hypothetical protein
MSQKTDWLPSVRNEILTLADDWMRYVPSTKPPGASRKATGGRWYRRSFRNPYVIRLRGKHKSNLSAGHKNRKGDFCMDVKFNFFSHNLQMQTNVAACLPSYSFSDNSDYGQEKGD